MSAARVGVAVTGNAEALGVAEALQQLWDTKTVVFEVVESHVDRTTKHYRAFTTDQTSPAFVEEQLRTIAARRASGERVRDHAVDEFVAAARFHLRSMAPDTGEYDFIVLLDDLELANRGNETAVVAVVRDAVERAARLGGWRPVEQQWLRERASFHLLDPMLEGYFFASAPSLDAVGARLKPPNKLGSPRLVSRDCEQFEVDPADIDYFAATGTCPRKRKDPNCPWTATPGQNKAEHPKKYLRYLCRGTAHECFCTNYKETEHGVAALQALDWQSVLAAGAPFLQALVEDLWQMLGKPPNIELAGNSNAPTARAKRAADAVDFVLRNL